LVVALDQTALGLLPFQDRGVAGAVVEDAAPSIELPGRLSASAAARSARPARYCACASSRSSNRGARITVNTSVIPGAPVARVLQQSRMKKFSKLTGPFPIGETSFHVMNS
jgi:hypothetical protein